VDWNATIKVRADAKLDALRQAAEQVKLVKDRTLAMEQAQSLLTRTVIGTDAAIKAHIKNLEAAQRNVDNTSKEYRQLGAAIDSYKAKLKEADAEAVKTGGGSNTLAMAAGVASRAVGALAVAAGLGSLGKLGMDAEVAAAKLRTMRNAIPDFENLQPLLEKVGKETGGLAGSAELSAAAYEVLSAGASSAADAAAKLKAALVLAQGGSVDTAVAVDGLTSIMNAYGVSTDRAAEVADKIRQTVDDGKISFEEYSTQIGKAAAVAAGAGVSLDELNAAVAAVTAGGIKAESAISGVRQLIVNIVKPTEDAKKTAEALGVQMGATALQSKGLLGVLEEIRKKTGGNAEAIGKLITDVDGLTAAQALMRNEGEDVAKMLEKQANAYGAAGRAADEMNDTAAAAGKRLAASWEGLADRLTKIWAPFFTWLADSLSWILDKSAEAGRWVAQQTQNARNNMPVQPLTSSGGGAGARLPGGGMPALPSSAKPMGGLAFGDVPGGIGATLPLNTNAGSIIPQRDSQNFLTTMQGLVNRTGGIEMQLFPLGQRPRRYDPLEGRRSTGDSLPDPKAKEAADKAAKDAEAAQKRLQDQRLQDQAEAFRNQQALDRQLLQNRQEAERQVYERKLELLKLSNERELLGLTGLAGQVAKFFTDMKERRKRDELELFRLQQQYQQQLFDAQQKRQADALEKSQQQARQATAATGTPGFDTFTALARQLGLSVTSAFRAGDPGYHGRNQARDYGGSSGSMMQFAKAMAEQFGTQLRELIYTPLGFGIKDGKRVPLSFWGDKTNRGHNDHVHVAFTGAMAPGTPARNNIVRLAQGRDPGDAAAATAAASATRSGIEATRQFMRQREAEQYALDFERITKGLRDNAKALDEEAAGLKLRAELIQRGFSPEEADRIAGQQERLNKLQREGVLALEQFDRFAKDSGLTLEEQARLRRELADAIQGEQTALENLFRVQEQNKERTKTFADGARAAFESYAQSAMDAFQGAEQVVSGALSRAEDALVEFVTTGKASFTDLVNSVLADLTRLVLRQQVLGPLAQVIGSFFGGGGVFGTTSFGNFDLLGGVLNGTGGLFANGGIMTPDGPLPLRTYANGGIATSPQVAIYGEGRMPEAYVPLPDGRRIPVAMQNQGQPSGGNTTVTVNVDARGTQVQGNDANGQQLGRVISQAVQAELIRQKRPGGLLVGA
jgi:TP901 family phage tail tape measure protein